MLVVPLISTVSSWKESRGCDIKLMEDIEVL